MKPVKPQFAVLITIAIFMLQACYCTSIPYVICMREDGSTYTFGLDDLWGQDECADNGDTHAGTSYNEPTPAPAVLPPNNGTNNIVAPTGGLNCNSLRLTSPTGLPNGSTTFYWDGVPNAVRYRITVYDNNGTYLATFDSEGSNTSLTADVSWGAIGGQYEIRIEITAFGNGTSCSRSVTLQREAPSGGVPNNGSGGNGGNGPAPTPTLTCAVDPRPECIR